MSNQAVVIGLEPQRVILGTDITSSYQAIGTAYSHPCRMYLLQNYSDAALQFSWDGVNDGFPLPAGGSIILDIGSNKSDPAGSLDARANRFTYVKLIGTPTTGSVYLSIFYGDSRFF